jgi:hypothetical protein
MTIKVKRFTFKIEIRRAIFVPHTVPPAIMFKETAGTSKGYFWKL